MSKVMVSIVCTNYNKISWISEAIESFLAQKANFEFEILLIDDKSTDGSVDIIKEYAKNNPSKIRAFYNKKNLGITKTWIEICKEAKGKYIARCDGDDHWTDSKKLQKQVDLLERSADSAWCGTDCDVIDSNGDLIQAAAFKSGFFARPTSYAEMFATKGITAPSTWVVDADLMREVNKDLAKDAIDDTFNIQLDLFNKTKFTYLPESTAVYRINEGSDSRPVDKVIAKARDKKLMESQLEYLDKYKKVDYEEIIRALLLRDMENEERNREGHDRLGIIEQQRESNEEQKRLLAEKDEIIRQKDRQIDDIIGSKKYRAGSLLASPLVAANNFLKRRKN